MIRKRNTKVPGKPVTGEEPSFAEVAAMIEQAKQRAYQAVNTELINLYWQIGQFISRKIAAAEWGEGVVEKLADYIRRRDPNLRGFTRRNLFRMRQFYETYAADKKVSPLLTQLPWTHNLLIMSQAKRSEEREFYLRMAIQERWSKRELERQIKTALFERSVLQTPKVSPLVRQLRPEVETVFKDAYVVEYLNLPDGHSERAFAGRVEAASSRFAKRSSPGQAAG
jgi:predicted nuclease of restriction endonuclease-like (RecB) superfamily